MAPGRRRALVAFHTDDEPPEAVFYCPECPEREFKGYALGSTPNLYRGRAE